MKNSDASIIWEDKQNYTGSIIDINYNYKFNNESSHKGYRCC